MINHMISLPFDRKDERHVEAGAPTESVSQEASRRLSLDKPLSASSLCLPLASVCLQPLSASSLCLPAASVCLQPLSASSLCLPAASVCLQRRPRHWGRDWRNKVGGMAPQWGGDGTREGRVEGLKEGWRREFGDEASRGLCSQQPVEKKRQGADGGSGAHRTPLLAPCPSPPPPATPNPFTGPLPWPAPTSHSTRPADEWGTR
ncbi:unnamed protein product [Arctogadus glacialis]